MWSPSGNAGPGGQILRKLRMCARGAFFLAARLPAVERGEEQRVDADRKDRAGEDQIAPILRQETEIGTEPGEDERELADLREADRDREPDVERAPECAHDRERRKRLADHDDRERREHRQRLAHEDARIEQHADRDEEEHRERVAERQRFLRGLVAQRSIP